MRSHAVLALLAVAAAVAIAVAQSAAGTPARPSGKIVFLGGSHVLVANSDGTGLRDLSRSRDDAVGVAVSPDGTKIVAELLGCCLVLMNANGNGRLLIANTPGSAAWAPDGKHFAYIGQPGSGDVHVVSATGGARRALPAAAEGGGGIAWSPDGSEVAFLTETGVGIVAAVGGPVTTPTGMAAADSVVGWSPDGTKIAFLTKKQALYVASVDGEVPTLVGRGQDPDSTPAWSPDGKRFLMTRGDPVQIHVVDADGTHDRRLTRSEWGEASSSPGWSPDGKSIAFLRGRLAGRFAAQDVWTMSSDGTGKRPLTTAFEFNGGGADSFWNKAVAWAPGRAAGGVSIRAPRTVPVHASRVATVPIVDSGVSADASGLAVSAGCMVRTWDGLKVRVLGPESGLGRWPCGGNAALASAGERMAWISSRAHNHDEYDSLFVAGPSGRRLVESAYSYCCGGGESSGKLLDHLAGDGPLLVYNTWTYEGPTYQLWRIDGSRKVLIRSDEDAGPVVAVNSGRIATLQADGTLTLLSGSGAKLSVRKLVKGIDALRLDGPHVVLLRHGRIEVYDTASGRRTQIRRLRMRPREKATLDDAQDGLVVYTTGIAVHVLRLANGRDIVLGLKDEASAAPAQLVPAGLYYAYNQAWTRRPGRLGLVSMQEIERLLARHG